MKTILNPKRKTAGGAILFTIVVTGVAAITMASYLRMVQTEYTTVSRSQTWNGSLVVAESGIEEALALINKYVQTTNWVTNWTTTAVSQDHWSVLPDGVFTKTQTNGNYGYYTVYVTNNYDAVNSNFIPQISSIGTAYWQGSDMTYGGNGATRTVYLQASGNASFSGGLLAHYNIDFNGNNVSMDSYDSSSKTASYWRTNWFYQGHNFGTYTNTLRTANVVVGTDGSLLNAGNANIYGYAATGPGGQVTIGPQATIGDLNWIGPDPGHPLNNGVQPGHTRQDMNVPFIDPVLPAGAASGMALQQPTNYTIRIGGILYTNNNDPYNYKKISSYTIGGKDYSLFITNILGNPGTPTSPIYYMNSSTLNQSLFISASNVVLYLPNGATLPKQVILTLNTNGNVIIYSGSDFDTQNGQVNNNFQYAPAFTLYGLATCTNVTFGANAMLTMKCDAPEASITFNGGGAGGNYDICGSIKAHDIVVKGHYNFHFDEVLKDYTPPTRFVPTAWEEVYSQ